MHSTWRFGVEKNPYIIYRLTSPSGKAYIGLTKNGLKERWRSHCSKAKCSDKRHPLLDSIRKHGPEAFETEVLETGLTKQGAKEAEVRWIADLSPEMNISPGGDADGDTAMRVFWEAMRSDPEALARYTQKLSKTRAAQMLESPEWRAALKAGGEAWRAQNPKEAYWFARRGLRLAMRANLVAHGLSAPYDPRFEKSGGRLYIDSAKVRKARGNWRKRTAVRRQWAEQDQSSRNTAISLKIKENWEAKSETEKEYHRAQLALARAKMAAGFKADPAHHERVKQKRREGIARYWAARRAQKESQPTTS